MKVPPYTGPIKSEPARVKLGLLTAEDVQREFDAACEGWSKGTLYLCPFCNKDFWSPSGARKHTNVQGHPVLRWDWYEDVGRG